MSDPDSSLPLQKAVLERLKVSVPIVSQRVYDGPPANAEKPYLSFGPATATAVRAQLYRGQGERFQIDAWSAGPSRAQVKAMVAQIVAALDGAALNVPGHRLITLEHEQTQYVREPDGVTQHAACIFTAATEPAS